MSDARTSPALLQVQGLVKRFGALVATDHVDLDVRSGEIHALIGPNGAGKTTVFNLLTKFFQPSAGTIVGGVEFEVERPKGDAGEMIDPEQLNLF